MNKVLEKLLTVDGASSGLDADKLDGQEGSYYQSKLNRTVGGNDNATGTVTDTGGNILVPIPLTLAAASATATQNTATTAQSLRAWAQSVRNNIAHLFANYQNASNLNAGTVPAARMPPPILSIVASKHNFGTAANFSTYQDSYTVSLVPSTINNVDVIQYNNPGTALGYFNFKVIFNISSVSVDLNALYTKKIILDLRPATSNIFPTRCFPGAARNPNQRYTWEKAITAGLSSGDPTVITNLINKNTSNYITSGMMIEVKATWSPSLNVIWLDLAMYYYTLQSTD